MPSSIPPDHNPRDREQLHPADREQPDWATTLVALLARTLDSPDPRSYDRAVALLRAVALPLAVIVVGAALVVLLVVLAVG